MGKELRLAFAMGGGVSLGTFSGGALSEVLKLTLLRGGYPVTNEATNDTEWHAYDRVVVDVFSGASAGAMSLAAMLRTLAHRTPEQEQQARTRLEKEYGEAFTRLPEAKKTQMVAAQAVQDVQEKIWVEDITLDRLLGNAPSGHRNLRHAGGILDRGAVEDIARNVISFPDGVDLSGRQLLGRRVLFASTLANLSSTLHDARTDLNTVKAAGFLGLADGMTSRTHGDLRVFDLNFAPTPEEATDAPDRYPGRWCRYHIADEDEGRIGDLRKPRTWNKIAATAIAAGAFPFAFEPVVLKRNEYEYGNLWPQELKDAGKTEYPFTFVDGGTFNNEPIREAFRLAAVMDAQDDKATFDRRVIFVDPSIQPLTTSLRVPIHQAHDLQTPNVFGSFDGIDLYRRSTLDRFVAHVGSLLTAVLNQARMIEGDKVYRVRQRFTLRDEIRRFIYEAVRSDAPPKELLVELKTYCADILQENAKHVTIPAGTLTLARELERVIAEEHPRLDALQGEAASFVQRSDPAAAEHADLWLRALIFVAVDLIMDLEGKHPNSRLVAIAPFTNMQEDDPLAWKQRVLPGHKVSGFGGFTSEVPGRYEVRLARYCAHRFLEVCEVIRPSDTRATMPRWTARKEEDYTRDLQQGLRTLADRIGALIKQSHQLNLSLGNTAVLGFVANKIERELHALGADRPETVNYEFRLCVPDKRFELDGEGLGDRDLRPIRLPGQSDDWFIVTYLDHASDEDGASTWSGPYLNGDRQLPVSRDGIGPLFDRHFCTIEMPVEEQLKAAALHPHPVFVATLKDDDKGKSIGADRWDVRCDVVPLEDQLGG